MMPDQPTDAGKTDHADLVKRMRERAALKRALWGDADGMDRDDYANRPVMLGEADDFTAAADALEQEDRRRCENCRHLLAFHPGDAFCGNINDSTEDLGSYIACETLGNGCRAWAGKEQTR